MKLIIAGGRDYRLKMADYDRLDEINAAERVTEVVSGGARGVDNDGQVWAWEVGLPVRLFLADWKQYGKGAGPRRNAEMAAYADAVALFPGGAGTQNMREQADRAGIKVYDFRNT